MGATGAPDRSAMSAGRLDGPGVFQEAIEPLTARSAFPGRAASAEEIDALVRHTARRMQIAVDSEDYLRFAEAYSLLVRLQDDLGR